MGIHAKARESTAYLSVYRRIRMFAVASRGLSLHPAAFRCVLVYLACVWLVAVAPCGCPRLPIASRGLPPCVFQQLPVVSRGAVCVRHCSPVVLSGPATFYSFVIL